MRCSNFPSSHSVNLDSGGKLTTGFTYDFIRIKIIWKHRGIMSETNWGEIILALIVFGTPLMAAFKRWSDLRLDRLQRDYDRLKTVRSEVAATVIDGVRLVEIFKILYIGEGSIDQTEMIKTFRVAGIEN